jgi:microcystin-dependent protein
VLLANGAAVSRTRYAKLFATIGTTFGAGDGSTTFNLPNPQGRMIVGRDPAQTEFDVVGETGGTETVTLSAAQYPAHSHTLTMQSPNGLYADANNYHSSIIVSDGGSSTSQGGGGAHNNRAPFQIVNIGVAFV